MLKDQFPRGINNPRFLVAMPWYLPLLCLEILTDDGKENLVIHFSLAVLASVYGVCSCGGSPGGNHLYLQSLKPPHTRNFQNFHFRNTTNQPQKAPWRKAERNRNASRLDVDEIQLGLESILGAVCGQDAAGFKSICQTQRGEELARRILWQKAGCKFQDKGVALYLQNTLMPWNWRV